MAFNFMFEGAIDTDSSSSSDSDSADDLGWYWDSDAEEEVKEIAFSSHTLICTNPACKCMGIPNNLLGKIFSYLPFYTLTAVELVCQHWCVVARAGSMRLWRHSLVCRFGDSEGKRSRFISQYEKFGTWKNVYRNMFTEFMMSVSSLPVVQLVMDRLATRIDAYGLALRQPELLTQEETRRGVSPDKMREIWLSYAPVLPLENKQKTQMLQLLRDDPYCIFRIVKVKCPYPTLNCAYYFPQRTGWGSAHSKCFLELVVWTGECALLEVILGSPEVADTMIGRRIQSQIGPSTEYESLMFMHAMCTIQPVKMTKLLLRYGYRPNINNIQKTLQNWIASRDRNPVLLLECLEACVKHGVTLGSSVYHDLMVILAGSATRLNFKDCLNKLAALGATTGVIHSACNGEESKTSAGQLNQELKAIMNTPFTCKRTFLNHVDSLVESLRPKPDLLAFSIDCEYNMLQYACVFANFDLVAFLACEYREVFDWDVCDAWGNGLLELLISFDDTLMVFHPDSQHAKAGYLHIERFQAKAINSRKKAFKNLVDIGVQPAQFDSSRQHSQHLLHHICSLSTWNPEVEGPNPFPDTPFWQTNLVNSLFTFVFELFPDLVTVDNVNDIAHHQLRLCVDRRVATGRHAWNFSHLQYYTILHVLANVAHTLEDDRRYGPKSVHKIRLSRDESPFLHQLLDLGAKIVLKPETLVCFDKHNQLLKNHERYDHTAVANAQYLLSRDPFWPLLATGQPGYNEWNDRQTYSERHAQFLFDHGVPTTIATSCGGILHSLFGILGSGLWFNRRHIASPSTRPENYIKLIRYYVVDCKMDLNQRNQAGETPLGVLLRMQDKSARPSLSSSAFWYRLVSPKSRALALLLALRLFYQVCTLVHADDDPWTAFIQYLETSNENTTLPRLISAKLPAHGLFFALLKIGFSPVRKAIESSIFSRLLTEKYAWNTMLPLMCSFYASPDSVPYLEDSKLHAQVQRGWDQVTDWDQKYCLHDYPERTPQEGQLGDDADLGIRHPRFTEVLMDGLCAVYNADKQLYGLLYPELS